MRERRISVSLSANIKDFQREMAEAAKSAREVGSSAKKTGEQSQTALGRMAQSARENAQLWDAVGSSALKAGGAIAGVGALSLKTGISYNTLQQTTRAALTTLLGSAEAANEQMDRLDEWARTSPFAKQVFITAQQQLIGFGMAAEKVIPTLDAIQNAVAAVGGSNDDIAEIVRVLAQVQSSGKFTAITLNQLGIRGIDGAKILADAYGVTAGEIRDQISSGALDARKALDDLVEGMQGRFGGAAANVKNTMTGAFDRVKAAWRDLSSDLAEPLVSKHGGGFLVDAMNRVADFMRWLQRLPEPIKASAVAFGVLTAAALLSLGAFLKLSPAIMRNVAEVRALAAAHPRAAAVMRGTAKAGVGLGLALTAIGLAMNDNSVASKKSATQIENDLRKIAAGASVAETTFEGLSGGMDFGALIQGLDDPSFWQQVGSGFSNLASGIGQLFGMDIRNDWQKQRDELKALSDGLGHAATTNLPQAVDAFKQLGREAGFIDGKIVQSGNMQALLNQMPEFRSELEKLALDSGLAADNNTLLGIALGDIVPEAAMAQDAVREFLGVVEESESMKAYSEALRDWGSQLGSVASDFIQFGSAFDAVTQRNRDAAQAQADAWNKSHPDAKVQKSWESFYDGMTVASKDYLAELESQMKAQLEWKDNMVALAERVSAETLYELAQMGPEAAPLIAQLVDWTDDELAKLDLASAAKTQVQAFGEAIIEEGGRIPPIQVRGEVVGIDAAVEDAVRRFQQAFGATARVTDRGGVLHYSRGNGVPEFHADGALYDGKVRAFADGGGIDTRGRYVPRTSQIRAAADGAVLWGEPETGWEAYISGKPGREAQNRKIWAEAGARLGVPVGASVGASQSSVQVVRVMESHTTQEGAMNLNLNGPIVLDKRFLKESRSMRGFANPGRGGV